MPYTGSKKGKMHMNTNEWSKKNQAVTNAISRNTQHATRNTPPPSRRRRESPPISTQLQAISGRTFLLLRTHSIQNSEQPVYALTYHDFPLQKYRSDRSVSLSRDSCTEEFTHGVVRNRSLPRCLRARPACSVCAREASFPTRIWVGG